MKEITILYDADDKELRALSIAQLEGECDCDNCREEAVAVARTDDGNICGFCRQHWTDFCAR